MYTQSEIQMTYTQMTQSPTHIVEVGSMSHLQLLGVFFFPVDFGVLHVLDADTLWTGVLGFTESFPVDLGVLLDITVNPFALRPGEFFGRVTSCCHRCADGFDASGSLVILLLVLVLVAISRFSNLEPLMKN